MKIRKHKDSKSMKFRKKWLKKNIELINITTLCEFKLGESGWCNEINEPYENIYHIQVYYRDECIANFNGNSCYVIDDDKYIIYIDNDKKPSFDSDFIIFRKVKI